MTGPHIEKGSARGCNLLPSHDHGSLVSPSDQLCRYSASLDFTNYASNERRLHRCFGHPSFDESAGQ